MATVNGVYTEMLIDRGAELSLINRKFIDRNKQHFKQSPVLTVNNTQLQTAISTKEKIDKQIYVNIANDEWSWEIPVLVTDNLVYDIIIGISHLKSVQTKLDLCGQIMEFMLKEKLYKIKLNYTFLKNSTIHNNEISVLLIDRK